MVSMLKPQEPNIPLNHFSSFSRLKRVTSWMFRFIKNCRHERTIDPSLSVEELAAAERYWVTLSQRDHFLSEISLLQAKKPLPSGSSVLSLHPFLDSDGILRVGGRESNAKLAYSKLHPTILHGKHQVTKLIIRSEHLRMLHAGPTLLATSLNRLPYCVSSQNSPVHNLSVHHLSSPIHQATTTDDGAATFRACHARMRFLRKSESIMRVPSSPSMAWYGNPLWSSFTPVFLSP